MEATVRRERPQVEARDGDRAEHAVVLFHDDAFVAATVAERFAPRILAGDGALFLTHPERWAAIRAALERADVDVEDGLRSGRLAFLEADDALAGLLAAPSIDRATVESIFAVTVDGVRRASPAARIAVYGDIVDILWQRGDADRAGQLEAAWSETVAGDDDMSLLLCGYRADPLDDAPGMGRLLPLCCAHDHVAAVQGGRSEAVRRALGEVMASDPVARDQIAEATPTLPLGEPAAEIAVLALRGCAPEAAARVVARTRSLVSEEHASGLAAIVDPASLLANLLHHAPIGFQVLDRHGGSLFVNETWVALFGAPPPDDYRVFDDPVAARLGVTDAVRKALAGQTEEVGPTWYDPAELGSATGRRTAIVVTAWPLFDRHGRVSHVALVHRDVTDEIVAREDLVRRERRFRSLVEDGEDVIWLQDEHGRVTWVSPSCRRVLGYPPAWFQGRLAAELVHPDDQQAAAEAHEASLASPGVAVPRRYRIRHADGRWRWMEGTATNRLAEEDVGGVVVNQHDITDHVEAEDQRRTAQKMEAVGRLAGGIAHDFNNLLSVVSGYGHLAVQRAEKGRDVRKEIATILDAADRGAALTRQLLAFGRRGVRNPEVLDAAEVVQAMRPLLSRLLGEDVRLDVDADAGACLRMDRSHLEQVVMNLAVNARDAMPEGGMVQIRVEADATRVVLRVSDTGRGIDPGLRDRLFEPFFTTKPNGHGLGLSTVFGITAEAGGTIEVDSTPGEGATFELVFPRVAASCAPAETSAGDLASSSGVETILVAEDEPDVRRYVASVLSDAGYVVHVAASAEEALRLAERVPTIDAVVTDVVMPGATGRELARALRSRRPGLRVVYVSGYAEHSQLAAELPAGARFLQKPVTPAQLLSSVRDLLDAPSGPPPGAEARV